MSVQPLQKSNSFLHKELFKVRVYFSLTFVLQIHSVATNTGQEQTHTHTFYHMISHQFKHCEVIVTHLSPYGTYLPFLNTFAVEVGEGPDLVLLYYYHQHFYTLLVNCLWTPNDFKSDIHLLFSSVLVFGREDSVWYIYFLVTFRYIKN